MFKTACILSVALTALLASAPAHAGQTGSIPVTIDDSTRTAFGSIGGAHNSPDTASSIGCTVLGFVGTNAQVNCFARDSAGREARCYVVASVSAAMVQVALAIGPSSSIFFAWDKAGSCVNLEVNNSSYHGLPTPAAIR